MESRQNRTYRQGLESAKAGKGAFSDIAKQERHNLYHRNLVIARLFAAQENQWVLKGGSALVWRDPSARTTRDIDVFNSSTRDIQVAVETFKQALNSISTPPEDVTMHCELVSIEEPKGSKRRGAKLQVHLMSKTGQELKPPVSIDLVIGCQITGEIKEENSEMLEAVLQADMPTVKLYPIVDHLADKVAATMQSYLAAGKNRESTRVKDLIDIAHIALTETIDGNQLKIALESERLERSLLPYSEGFICPENWAIRYSNKRVEKGKAPQKFEEALALAQALINPAIFGQAKNKTWRDGEWQ